LEYFDNIDGEILILPRFGLQFGALVFKAQIVCMINVTFILAKCTPHFKTSI